MHGFFPEPGTTQNALWKATLLSIGITATTCWILAARVHYSPRVVSWIELFAAAQFVAYAVVVLWVNSEFGVAIVAYLPAAMFLLIVLTLEHRGSPSPALTRGILGFVLTFVAAAIQARGRTQPPRDSRRNPSHDVAQANLFAGEGIGDCSWLTIAMKP